MFKDGARVGRRCFQLGHVLDSGRQADPGMHAIFVHGKQGDWEAGIGKRSDGDCNVFFVSLDLVVHGRPALRAEVKCDFASRVAYAYERRRLPGDLHGAPCEACLSAEHAAGPALTGETVTNRDANGLLARRETKLPAATGRNTFGHGATTERVLVAWRPEACEALEDVRFYEDLSVKPVAMDFF